MDEAKTEVVDALREQLDTVAGHTADSLANGKDLGLLTARMQRTR